MLYVNNGEARGYCGDPAIWVLLCFRRGVTETSILLGCYVTCVGSLVPTPIVPIFMGQTVQEGRRKHYVNLYIGNSVGGDWLDVYPYGHVTRIKIS